MAYKSSLVFKLQIYYVFSVVLLNLYLYVLGLNYLLCLVVTLLCLNCCIIIFYEDFVMLELDFDVLWVLIYCMIYFKSNFNKLQNK